MIHQRIEFKEGSAVVEDTNVPALICVADIMLQQPLVHEMHRAHLLCALLLTLLQRSVPLAQTRPGAPWPLVNEALYDSTVKILSSPRLALSAAMRSGGL